MKLLTYVMLSCNVRKGCQGPKYPLKVELAAEGGLLEEEVEEDVAFTRKMLHRFPYPTLLHLAKQLGLADGLPEELPLAMQEEEDEGESKNDDEEVKESPFAPLLEKLHHLLLEVRPRPRESPRRPRARCSPLRPAQLSPPLPFPLTTRLPSPRTGRHPGRLPRLPVLRAAVPRQQGHPQHDSARERGLA